MPSGICFSHIPKCYDEISIRCQWVAQQNPNKAPITFQRVHPIDFSVLLKLNELHSTEASYEMIFYPSSNELFCRSSYDKPNGEIAEDILADEEKDLEPEEEEHIFCRKCQHIITRPEEAIQVNGQHQHTFANPHGLIFEIGCFQMAEGCGYIGQKTAEWSWFKGFSWKVAVCGKCLVQVGWIFISLKGLDNFHGLILERLVFPKG